VRLALDLLGAGHEALIQLRDLPAEALMHADYQAPRIASARAAVVVCLPRRAALRSHFWR
jgi:hypothetical protein